MTDGPVLTLHIGIPKTASTWLQTAVFPRLPGVLSVNVPQAPVFALPRDAAANHRVLVNALARSTAVWEGYGDTLFGAMLGDKRGWLEAPRDVVVSEEGIGRSGSHPRELGAHLSAMTEAARQWGFARVQVLCLVRRQDHWLASHYAQVSDRADVPGQASFVELIDRVLDPTRSRFGFGMLLQYDALHRAIADAIGAENLQMLPYEMLAADAQAFYRAVIGFLGLPPNAAPPIEQDDGGNRNARRSGEGVWRLRARPRTSRLDRLRKRIGLAAPLADAGVIKLSPELSRRVLEGFAPSNTALARHLTADIGRYGYLLPDTRAADIHAAD